LQALTVVNASPKANPPRLEQAAGLLLLRHSLLDDRNRKDSDRVFAHTACKLATISERDEFIGTATKPPENCCKKI
jgi:hypothetical protein